MNMNISWANKALREILVSSLHFLQSDQRALTEEEIAVVEGKS